MRLKRSFCNSENWIGSELLQVSEVSHKSWSLTIWLLIKRLQFMEGVQKKQELKLEMIKQSDH